MIGIDWAKLIFDYYNDLHFYVAYSFIQFIHVPVLLLFLSIQYKLQESLFQPLFMSTDFKKATYKHAIFNDAVNSD